MLTALVGGSLIDGTGRDPLSGATVLIDGNKITWVGPSSKASLPAGCNKIDVTGRTLMPGMIDLHVHLSWGDTDPEAWPRGILPPLLEHPLTLVGIKGYSRARRALDAGVTTLRDVGDVGHLGVAVRDAVASGIVVGPRVVACGTYLNASSGHGNAMPPWLVRTDVASNVADGVDAIIQHVRTQVRMNTDWVKYVATGGGTTNTWDEEQFTDAEVTALVTEAHRKSRLVCAHCVQSKGTLQAVRAGVDTIEHGSLLTEEIVGLMVQKGAFLVPTLYAPCVIAERGLELGVSPDRVANCRVIAQRHVESARMALDAGVKIGFGTDSGLSAVPHGTNAYELELLVKHLGMTPMQAIVTATSSSAAALRWLDRLGTIEAGKLADIVVVKGDPLSDIRVLQQKGNIALVVKDGAVCVDRI